ncbi:hypothetical protein Tco_0825947 [Tanacetum coccineum]
MPFTGNVARFDRPPIHSSRPNISTRPAANGASSFASGLKGYETYSESVTNEKENSSDPFNHYNLLNKRDKGKANSGLDSRIPFPPGFTLRENSTC